jgi:pilus assembly protein CpaB
MALRLPRLRINRTWLMLGIAVVLGLGATWLTIQYLKVREQRMEADITSRTRGGPTIKVAVPIKDMMKGMVIDGSVVAAREVQSDLVAPDAITPDNFEKFQGSRLVRDVMRGRPLTASDLESRDRDFSDMLAAGNRAITINVDDLNSIAQMVRPGNLVDLFLILPDMSDQTGNNQQIVLLLQRLKVLATGQTVRGSGAEDAPPGSPPGSPPGASRYTTFTFEVSPDEAARIALAQQLGTFRAVLRSEPDQEMVRLGKINTRNLLKKGYSDEAPDERDESAVEYIIGGRGQGGVGNTLTVNVPGLMPGMASMPGAQPAPAPGAANGPAAALPPAAQQYVPMTPTTPPAKK